jgi:hypothetical protein
MGLGDLVDFDPWDEPDEEDYRAVDEELLTTLLVGRVDGLRPVRASVEFTDIRQTARWYLAFDIGGWESRRRKFAQKKVAQKSGKKLSAVQGKVRDVYDAKAGRKSAQELFEEDLEAIEQAYQSHFDAQ